MLNLEITIRQLTANAQAIRAMYQTIPEEQAQWKPGPEIWSLKEVIEHVYNEERIDFRKHIREMFAVPPQAWDASEPSGWITAATCQQALDGFLSEREDSIAWLRALSAPDWNITFQAPWGPLRAGDVLVSWVEHDFLHLRQMIEVLYAWNEQQAAPYSVQYAGGW